MRVRILVLPVYKRYWLYHATIVEGVRQELQLGGKPWYEYGTTWSDKVAALSLTVNKKVGAEPAGCRLWMLHLPPRTTWWALPADLWESGCSCRCAVLQRCQNLCVDQHRHHERSSHFRSK
jgi:hypothetical protein